MATTYGNTPLARQVSKFTGDWNSDLQRELSLIYAPDSTQAQAVIDELIKNQQYEDEKQRRLEASASLVQANTGMNRVDSTAVAMGGDAFNEYVPERLLPTGPSPFPMPPPTAPGGPPIVPGSPFVSPGFEELRTTTPPDFPISPMEQGGRPGFTEPAVLPGDASTASIVLQGIEAEYDKNPDGILEVLTDYLTIGESVEVQDELEREARSFIERIVTDTDKQKNILDALTKATDELWGVKVPDTADGSAKARAELHSQYGLGTEDTTDPVKAALGDETVTVTEAEDPLTWLSIQSESAQGRRDIWENMKAKDPKYAMMHPDAVSEHDRRNRQIETQYILESANPNSKWYLASSADRIANKDYEQYVKAVSDPNDQTAWYWGNADFTKVLNEVHAAEIMTRGGNMTEAIVKGAEGSGAGEGDVMPNTSKAATSQVLREYANDPDVVIGWIIQKSMKGVNPVQRAHMPQMIRQSVNKWIYANPQLPRGEEDPALAGMEKWKREAESNKIMATNVWDQWASNNFEWKL